MGEHRPKHVSDHRWSRWLHVLNAWIDGRAETSRSSGFSTDGASIFVKGVRVLWRDMDPQYVVVAVNHAATSAAGRRRLGLFLPVNGPRGLRLSYRRPQLDASEYWWMPAGNYLLVPGQHRIPLSMLLPRAARVNRYMLKRIWPARSVEEYFERGEDPGKVMTPADWRIFAKASHKAKSGRWTPIVADLYHSATFWLEREPWEQGSEGTWEWIIHARMALAYLSTARPGMIESVMPALIKPEQDTNVLGWGWCVKWKWRKKVIGYRYGDEAVVERNLAGFCAEYGIDATERLC